MAKIIQLYLRPNIPNIFQLKYLTHMDSFFLEKYFVQFPSSEYCHLHLIAVLLRNIKQQIFQCHRACPRSDHGKCAFLHSRVLPAALSKVWIHFLFLSQSVRGCILFHLCCWCAWACHWSTAPSWQRFWENSSSTSTTAGLMSSSWSALCPASFSFTSPTSRHQKNTWPSEHLWCV